MSMAISNGSNVEAVTSVQRRRRWTVEEKIGGVRRALEPGMTVSLTAREAGVAPSQVFQWERLYLAICQRWEPMSRWLAASELQDAQHQIKRLGRALGRKTLENEILREAVDFAKAKKWLARSPALPEDGQ